MDGSLLSGSTLFAALIAVGLISLRRRMLARHHLPPPSSSGCFGIIVGSSPPREYLCRLQLIPFIVSTPFGRVTLHRAADPTGRGIPIIVLFRHTEALTTVAPNINHRAHIWALRAAGVTVLLLLSSVGAIAKDVPRWTPVLIDDLLMLDNRLPDGSPCTYGNGYLISPGASLLSRSLITQLQQSWIKGDPDASLRTVTYWYQVGPRVKSKAESRLLIEWALMSTP